MPRRLAHVGAVDAQREVRWGRDVGWGCKVAARIASPTIAGYRAWLAGAVATVSGRRVSSAGKAGAAVDGAGTGLASAALGWLADAPAKAGVAGWLAAEKSGTTLGAALAESARARLTTKLKPKACCQHHGGTNKSVADAAL